MKILDQPLPGVYILESVRHSDVRGDFVKIFSADLFAKIGINFEPKEEFYSVSKRNVIRGMHFQRPPSAHDKLVYCSRGEVLDVVVDLRMESSCYRQVKAIRLSEKRPVYIYIPKGCAHGFLSLEDDSIVAYLTSTVHDPELDDGVRWDTIGFDWPCANPILSKRDTKLPAIDELIVPNFAPKRSCDCVPGRALITGASGFVGSRLADYLLRKGWQVGVLLRTNSSEQQLVSFKDKIEIYRVELDYCSVSSVMAEFKPTCVFHTAAWTLHDYKPVDVREVIDANVQFGANIVEAMLANNVRNLVNTGTSWQHYEDMKYNPVNLYAATKQAFEDLLMYYSEVRGLQVVTLKLFDTFGEGDSRPKLINLLSSARKSGQPLLLSPGEQVLDLVWVEDVVDGYLQAVALFNEGSGFHYSYGLSGGDRMNLKEFVRIYEEITQSHNVAILGARAYRLREVMKPWVPAEPLPGWRATPGAIIQFLKKQS